MEKVAIIGADGDRTKFKDMYAIGDASNAICRQAHRLRHRLRCRAESQAPPRGARGIN